MKFLPKLAAAQVSLFALLVLAGRGPADANATPTIVNGDCWQAGTPMVCRTTWAGAGQLLYLRVINQYPSGSGTLWNNTVTAYGNWNVPEGAQSFSDSARSNDSWIYMKRDDNMGADSGLTWNCNQYASPVCSPFERSLNIQWSEIFVSGSGTGTPKVKVIAHELGHALGLSHSANSQSLMKAPSQYTAPYVPLDIAADSECVGEKGVSCIYRTN